ncbi:MAG TPA: class I SAM-dependent methyltransferase [Gemmatimonadales bacterium]
MTPCCSSSHCAAAHYFDETRASQELAAYHRAGSGKTTRRLLAGLRASGAAGTLLDVGSGSGVLTLELLKSGVTEATCVDASAGSLRVARQEAERQGVAQRIRWHEGDMVVLGPTLPVADIVTLDRVVCCYHAWRALLEEAAKHSRRWLAFSYPRDRWYVRVGVQVENLWLRLRGNAFRAFYHPVGAMDAVLRESGLRPIRHDTTAVWQASIYGRG